MEQSPGLEDCLNLLKGERDEQRLAGLLLATKFCKGDDHASIRRVYDAVSAQFLDRLLRTGMGKIGNKEGEDSVAYLQLSVNIITAICRVPEIAASKDMVSKIPHVLEILQQGSGPSMFDECYEFLFLVSTASEDGVTTLYESGGIAVIASHMASLPDGCHSLELAMRLVQLMVCKLPPDITYIEYPSYLSSAVATIARQFALLHNALKFEAQHLLCVLLSSKHSEPLHDALRMMPNDTWAVHIRIGIVAVLQNRVAPVEKFRALVLSESLISILGERWLINYKTLPDDKDVVPVDRCLLLVLESSRVEVAVLLDELAYLNYEASKSSSDTALAIPLKQQNLAIVFSLIEKIIKLISDVTGTEGSSISESTIMKIIAGLDETTGLVLEFLQDAKEHGRRKGDDLLASVRIVGSYLAEAPMACKEKVRDLLEFILSVESEDEASPFYCICFMLPMLCQMTMEAEGCRILTSVGGFRAVVDCLVKLIDLNSSMVVEDSGTIFLACDTIMNVLLKKAETSIQLDESTAVRLLRALAYWTENLNDLPVTMMASSIYALIFDTTSEEALLNHPDFNLNTLNSLSRLIAKSLATSKLDVMSDDTLGESDLHQIVTEGEHVFLDCSTPSLLSSFKSDCFLTFLWWHKKSNEPFRFRDFLTALLEFR